jgi:nucleoside-diphosphate-sugar epimerase
MQHGAVSGNGLAASKVLVTGAAGFLGSHLCRRLHEGGAEVHAVSRSDRRDDVGGVRWVRSSFDDPGEVDGILRAVRPDVVYHLGGHVSAAPDITHVLPTFSSLLASTVHVLARATELGARRVVLVGSSVEPGDPDEVPSSPYAAAKWCGRIYGRMFHQLYETPVVVTRPSWTYGPGQREDKVIPYVIASLLKNRAPRLSSGALATDWIYVDDVIDGLLKAATVPDVVGEEIDLGTGSLLSIRDVVGQIVDILKPSVQPEFGALPERTRERVRPADVERTWDLLGWRASTSLATGLERTIAWHRRRL